MKCGKCETCQPGNSMKRSVDEELRIIQHKTRFPCKKCINCKNNNKECVDPRTNNLKYTSQEFQNCKLRLMIRKGVYP